MIDRQPLCILATLLALLVAPASASAALTITEHPIPTAASSPQDITQGPDGKLYFTENAANKIGTVVAGDSPTITDTPLPDAAGNPFGIAVGADNNIWFTENGEAQVGRLVPGSPPTITEFPIAGLAGARGIALGPDGLLYVVSSANDRVIRVNSAGAKVDEILTPGYGPRGITLGPDGRMYVTGFGGDKIGQINPATGTLTGDFNVAPNSPWFITSAPDGNLYASVPDGGILRVTTAGAFQLFAPPGLAGDLFDIVFAPDGALFSPRAVANDVARMTLGGSYSFLAAPTAASRPEYLTNAPGNTIYGTEKDGNQIFRITGLEIPGGTTPITAPGDPFAPTITGQGLSRKNVLVGPGATPVSGTSQRRRRRTPTGTTIRYTLSEPATVRLRMERILAGRRSGRRCVTPRRRLRKRRKCNRFRHAGTLVRTSKQGRNNVRFTGRIGRRALKRGRYRLVMRATDAAGNRSSVKRLRYRIVKPKKRKRARRR